MATITQQPYNLFAPKPLVETPKLKKPVGVYDPTKSVEENMAGKGNPSATNIAAAYQTPQAQLQTQQTPKKETPAMQVSPETESTAGMDYLNSLHTSPQEEERLRKASVMNQRILAVGDALRHIGNIYNTVNYAPSQQFNRPWDEERQRYEKSKAIRDAANAKYYTYQQQKAAQEAKMRQFEREQDYKNRMLAHYQDQDRRLWARDAETARRNSVLEYLKEQQMQLNKEFQEKKISIAEYNARTSRINAERKRVGGSSANKGDWETEITYEPNEYDPITNKLIKQGAQHTKRTYKGGGKNGGSSSSSSGNNQFGGKRHGGGSTTTTKNNFGVKPAK